MTLELIGVAIVAILVAIGAAFGVGRRSGAAKAENRALKADAASHERMNHADTHGADDPDNAQWMRDFAERNRR